MSRKSFMTLAMLVCLGSRLLLAQGSFNSGSNNSDGALDLTGHPPGVVWFYPNSYPGNQHAQGIFNWTTITIPTGVTLKLSGFITGMPLYFLASGNVNVQGVIDLSGANGANVTNDVGTRIPAAPGAGGYTGGVGGNPSNRTLFPGEPGSGQGGGAGAGGSGPGHGGVFSASGYLIPLVGGSGGGGAMANSNGVWGAGGGGGGGALMIASSTSIAVSGTVSADGGSTGVQDYYTGGGGSGGGIRLVSNTITGSGTLTAKGGCPSGCSYAGGPGTVRIEAYTNTFTGTINGNSGRSTPYQLLLPTAGQSTIQVTSINGTPINANPFQFPDIEINTGSPVPVVIGATQIPIGTASTVTVTVFTETGDQTITGCQLAGTLASSTCTVQITFPGGGTWGLVKATWR